MPAFPSGPVRTFTPGSEIRSSPPATAAPRSSPSSSPFIISMPNGGAGPGSSLTWQATGPRRSTPTTRPPPSTSERCNRLARLDWVEPSERAVVLTDLAKVQYRGRVVRGGDDLPALRDQTGPRRPGGPRPTSASNWPGAITGWARSRPGAAGDRPRLEVGGRREQSPKRAEPPPDCAAVRAGLLSDQFRPRMALKMGLQAVDEAETSGEAGALARAYTKIDEAYQILGMRDDAVHEERALEIYEELGDLNMGSRSSPSTSGCRPTPMGAGTMPSPCTPRPRR